MSDAVRKANEGTGKGKKKERVGDYMEPSEDEEDGILGPNHSRFLPVMPATT